MSALTLLLTSIPAWACACCIDRGFYSISTGKPRAYELAMLDEMKFDSAVDLYMTEAGFDGIRGLEVLDADEEAGKSIELSLTETFAGKKWRLDVKTAGGRQGTLTLPMATLVNYKVDLHDNPPDTEPGLYKELRFKGRASGTGMFRHATSRPASYFLVFQGRGNGCDSSSDYTRWRLELDGPRADFAFFGKLMP